jgi:DNA-3-methyladenine glycosylase II
MLTAAVLASKLRRMARAAELSNDDVAGSREAAGGRRLASDRWSAGRAVIRGADPRMAALVDARPRLDPDAFFDTWATDLWPSLVSQVIGQQLSLAAAGAIRARLSALGGGRLPTPAETLAIGDARLRAVGLSRAKAVYLRDLAARLVDGRLDADRLGALDDDGIRRELMRAKGVGRFTADGVLLLTYRRPDVWPAADLSLRRAVRQVWALADRPTIVEVDAIGERFRPWRTLAAVYLLTLDLAQR